MRTYLFLLIAFFSALSTAQNQNNYWYFGDEAGIDFSSGTATAVTNGQMLVADMSATVSDANGNLLFYTNGETVWNSNHVVMAGGTGLNGNFDGGQTATIVQRPGSSTEYYIFTLDKLTLSGGLSYTVVDMSLNGGLGGVTSLNNSLNTPNTEKAVAVLHSNGTDVWLISHDWGNSNFQAYLIDNSGVNTTPVTSTVGTVHSGGSLGTYNAMGQMNASPDGSKLALGIYDQNLFELYDFDNNIGTVSNPITITGFNKAWGCEFSPDGSKLYVTRWQANGVWQMDLSTYTQSAISASVMQIGTADGPNGTYDAGYVSLGPDDKVYIAKWEDDYLSVINDPNDLGLACNFVNDGLYLAGKLSKAGLPINVQISAANCSVEIPDKTTDYWYFGDEAGIDFSSGTATAVTNSQMLVADMSATVSDANGNLLFYTNGETIWNSNHAVMTGGTGLNGNWDGGQTATIVQRPGSSTEYYIFTLDKLTLSGGLSYTVVDMSLNGGLGGVTSLNNSLNTPNTEKAVAVLHSNGTDIWLISHDWGNANFQAYLIDNSGLTTTPVISTVGAVHSGGSVGTYNAMGQMNASPDGTKLALGIYDQNLFELFDFDNNTGAVSNPITITGFNKAWGCEFSPDGSKLYVTRWQANGVWQMDLSTYTQSAISASVMQIGTADGPNGTYDAGYVSLGPDDKIYIAKWEDDYLSVINDPNDIGLACNFVNDGLYLAGKLSKAGLPVNMKRPAQFSPMMTVSASTNNVSCFGGTDGDITLLVSGGIPDYSFNWSGLTDTVNTVSGLAAGNYLVEIVDATGCTINDSVSITEPPVLDLTLSVQDISCYGELDGQITASSSGGTLSHVLNWAHNGSPNSTVSNLSQGYYSVSLTDGNGCTVLDSAYIDEPDSLFSSYTDTLCKGETYYFGSQQLISGGVFNEMFITSEGCDSAVTLNLIFSAIDTSVTYLDGNFKANASGLIYQWIDCNTGLIVGETDQFFTPSSNGNYAVIVNNGTCSDTSSCYPINDVSIDELGSITFEFYPNPVNDMVNVNFQKEAHIKIYSNQGKLVFVDKIHGTKSLDLSGLAKGIYTIELISADNGESGRRKFVKQ